MLNAFRHHRNSHFAACRMRRTMSKCSTPFGIIGILTDRLNIFLFANRVLNAFRHHRNSHPLLSSHFYRPCMCSTPFGIIGILTLKWSPRLSRFSRAQRLSASSEFSQTKLASASKPFLVLNAFRHHRNSHASRTVMWNRFRFVLNAFRHHRNSHSQFLRVPVIAIEVLNAFRHHRNSHCAPANPPICHAIRISFRAFGRAISNSLIISLLRGPFRLTTVLRIFYLWSPQASSRYYFLSQLLYCLSFRCALKGQFNQQAQMLASRKIKRPGLVKPRLRPIMQPHVPLADFTQT